VGFGQALKMPEYDAIIQMDADLSHDPSYLPEFLKALEKYDMVLGSRYLHGISVVNWDFKRLILSKGASLYVKVITSMPYSDATGGFKAWRREALSAIGLDQLFSNGYLFQIETTYRLHRTKGFSIGEISIIFRDRDLGRSKIDFPIILEAVWGVIRLRLTGR
jgi:dolichol-phosphate mannosyltransferase